MEESSAYQSNPWSDDDRSLGALRKLLFIAERTGHVQPEVQEKDETQANDLEESECADSLKMITLLKGISQRRRKIEEVNLDIQCHLLDKESKDITCASILEKRIEILNELISHIEKIISHKDQLISCLQQPYVGDFLKVDASYKKYVSEVFPQIVPMLSELSSQLDNIAWAHQVDIKDGQLESVLSSVTSSFAGLQSNFQSLYAISEKFQDLHDQLVDQSKTS